MRIAKTFRWEMGHRLPDHPGGCRNLHGHSYRMRIEVEGRVGANGMIIDFDEITQAVRPLIHQLDHAFLCTEADTELATFLEAQDFKRVLVPFASTVENICTFFADRLEPVFASVPHVDAFAVTIHETETSSATIERPVQRG